VVSVDVAAHINQWQPEHASGKAQLPGRTAALAATTMGLPQVVAATVGVYQVWHDAFLSFGRLHERWKVEAVVRQLNDSLIAIGLPKSARELPTGAGLTASAHKHQIYADLLWQLHTGIAQ
jgi:hypothetical protein